MYGFYYGARREAERVLLDGVKCVEDRGFSLSIKVSKWSDPILQGRLLARGAMEF